MQIEIFWIFLLLYLLEKQKKRKQVRADNPDIKTKKIVVQNNNLICKTHFNRRLSFSVKERIQAKEKRRLYQISMRAKQLLKHWGLMQFISYYDFFRETFLWNLGPLLDPEEWISLSLMVMWSFWRISCGTLLYLKQKACKHKEADIFISFLLFKRTKDNNF